MISIIIAIIGIILINSMCFLVFKMAWEFEEKLLIFISIILWIFFNLFIYGLITKQIIGFPIFYPPMFIPIFT